MASRTITLSAPKNIDGVVWPAGTYALTDDGWAEALVARGGGAEAAPVPTYTPGQGWKLGRVKLPSESHITRTVTISVPRNINGIVWPAGTYVCRDDGHIELLRAAGATESDPVPVRVAGRGWVLV